MRCSECYAETTQVTDAAKGHNYKTEETVAPTCTEQRYDVEICSECGNEHRTNFTDVLEHTIVIDKAIAATCSQVGYTEGSHCAVCNTVIVAAQEIPKTEHTDSDGDGYCDICSSLIG